MVGGRSATGEVTEHPVEYMELKASSIELVSPAIEVHYRIKKYVGWCSWKVPRAIRSTAVSWTWLTEKKIWCYHAIIKIQTLTYHSFFHFQQSLSLTTSHSFNFIPNIPLYPLITPNYHCSLDVAQGIRPPCRTCSLWSSQGPRYPITVTGTGTCLYGWGTTIFCER